MESRGSYYQLENPQGKLVRVSRGLIFDVAVDVRFGSPNLVKRCLMIESSSIWVPEGLLMVF